MYADDLILFLNDLGPSHKEALHILSDFSKFSRLMVNWDKSQILPIDPEACCIADPNLPLLWADRIRNLGIVIFLKSTDYSELNLVPLIQNMKTRLKDWANLPLSLVGHISLLKMKLLPGLLYVLSKFPCVDPQEIF